MENKIKQKNKNADDKVEIVWDFNMKKMQDKKIENMAEKIKENNWIKNSISNFKKIKASPYASLVFALKVRKIIIGVLSIYLAYMGFNMVKNYQATGFMGTFGKLIMAGVFVFIIYSLYKTIPMAQKQLDYYKKYPHLINYCPTNTKETIDDIFKKIQENKEKKEENKSELNEENSMKGGKLK